MTPLIKTFFLFLLLLFFGSSSGKFEGIEDKSKVTSEVGEEANMKRTVRKLVMMDEVLDYDYGGPNPRHDPRKGKPGGGGKNP